MPLLKEPPPVFIRYFQHKKKSPQPESAQPQSAPEQKPSLQRGPAPEPTVAKSSNSNGASFDSDIGPVDRVPADNGIAASRKHKKAAAAMSRVEIVDSDESPPNIRGGYDDARYDWPSAPEIEANIPAGHMAVARYVNAGLSDMSKDSWMAAPEIPTGGELKDELEPWHRVLESTGEIIIGRNEVRKPWASKEEYLRNHYHLLREEVVFNLRHTVVTLSKMHYPEEFTNKIGLYNKVFVTELILADRGLGVRVSFSLERVGKNVNWEQSKRLMTGSLVALTPADDKFRTKIIPAVVAARPLSLLNRDPPEIDLFFANPDDIPIDSTLEFMMAEERSSFFEAHRHTMVALQRMMNEEFPLSEHLVNVKTKVEAPVYLQKSPFVDLGAVFKHPLGDDVMPNILKDWPKGLETGLDDSQEEALQRFLTKRLAILQGPPGTGKTFVSATALKVMIQNMRDDSPPIIVACQTNHAIDQLLRQVAAFEPNFARLGGRSKDQEVIKPRTLWNLKNDKKIGVSRAAFKDNSRPRILKLRKDMLSLLDPLHTDAGLMDPVLLRRLDVISEAQFQSLLKDKPEWAGSKGQHPKQLLSTWLGDQKIEHKRLTGQTRFSSFEETEIETEQLEELEAEAYARDDDDIEALKGESAGLWDQYVGKGGDGYGRLDIASLAAAQNVWTVTEKYRGRVYNIWVAQAKELLRREFARLAVKYNQLVIALKASKDEHSLAVLKKQKIVGMTTTGLAKYRALVSTLNPKVVLIEEAAETIEAPIAAGCVPSVQHLILVGDHKQLRPNCVLTNHNQPGTDLNVSLFERLVNLGVEYSMLKRQRRMIPEVRRLIAPIYGKEIEDHPIVLDPEYRPDVPGMGGVNSFFFDHQHHEQLDTFKSRMNSHEAAMLVGFTRYLLYNGMKESQITILTFYHAQRKMILSTLRQKVPGRRIKVVTVDSYQGEENDVILLSLTRNNKDGNIGFLENDNRTCVALSRAKRGFYLFGNSQLLSEGSDTWKQAVHVMTHNTTDPVKIWERRVGDKFPVTCAKHLDSMLIEFPFQWYELHGGCPRKCEGELPCGHPCMITCHPCSHEEVFCDSRCERTLECGHPCTSLYCGGPCVCRICNNVPDELPTAPRIKEPRPAEKTPKDEEHRGPVTTSLWNTYADTNRANIDKSRTAAMDSRQQANRTANGRNEVSRGYGNRRGLGYPSGPHRPPNSRSHSDVNPDTSDVTPDAGDFDTFFPLKTVTPRAVEVIPAPKWVSRSPVKETRSIAAPPEGVPATKRVTRSPVKEARGPAVTPEVVSVTDLVRTTPSPVKEARGPAPAPEVPATKRVTRSPVKETRGIAAPPEDIPPTKRTASSPVNVAGDPAAAVEAELQEEDDLMEF
ncbi:P-loop containing nucleoside triphosphate hydrolase protein [Trichodelitschia bisporula]|uniref:P-loop containing nucleoside triphosphate hydrolase protein n=1 Tax=Trichodelitschia bisporula TaxID=703511 RepID=A0A6G1HPI5_9PEZI|nr:P-loop containing nucleoside triphosphate hydrolase protein [Trichodelitschia bisporula]